jgi:hypothetical protein
MHLLYISMYFNVFIIFLCIFMVCYGVFRVYFNVFVDIVIGISPSHSHYSVFAMHTHLCICFSLSTMTPFVLTLT